MDYLEDWSLHRETLENENSIIIVDKRDSNAGKKDSLVLRSLRQLEKEVRQTKTKPFITVNVQNED